MFKLGLFFFALLVAHTLVADTTLPMDYADAGCISKISADEYVRLFDIQINTFPKLDRCDPKNPLHQILTALDVMRHLQFTSQKISPLDRDFLDTDYFGFFLKRIKKIAYEGPSPSGAQAVFSRGAILLYAGFGDLPLAYLESLLVHEARHAEGYFHVQCTHGNKLNISNRCDSHYSTGGAYAVQIEMLIRMATRGRNLHPGFKSIARLSALAEVINSVNERPVKRTEALALVRRNDGTLEYLKEGRLISTKMSLSHSKQLMYSPSQGYLFTTSTDRHYPPQIIDPYLEWSPPEISTLSHYRKMILFAQDRELIEVKAMDDENNEFVTLFDQQLVWDSQIKGEFSKSDQISAISPKGDRGPYLVRSGKLFKINKKHFGHLEIVDTGEKWPSDLAQVILYEQKVVGLTKAGKLIRIDNGEELKLTQGHSYRDVVRVIFYSGL